MDSPTTFRIPASKVRAWAERLTEWRGLRGVPAVVSEIEAAAGKADAAGEVTLTRHQLFSWAESLQGAASKLPIAGAEAARQLSQELRAVYTGGAVAPPAPTPRPSAASATNLSWEAPVAPALVAPQPPVSYIRAPAAMGASETTRLVEGRDLGATVQSLLRGARQELLILSPWRGGIDTLLGDLVALPPSVAVRLITRRPEPDDPAYHRALVDLRHRSVDLAVSPYLHTRMVLVDGQTLLLGAASYPGPSTPYSRECAILTTDAKTVADARLHFATIQREVRG
jgi:phosphatidylserine/phosphatidylglycerophosphate/cardiolipin synthase-like enzyme